MGNAVAGGSGLAFFVVGLVVLVATRGRLGYPRTSERSSATPAPAKVALRTA